VTPAARWRALIASIIIPTALTLVISVAVTFAVYLPSFSTALLDRKRDAIRELANAAWSILAHYELQERTGAMTRTEAQGMARDRVGSLRYGPEGKDYFWLQDMHPRMVMHPYRRDLDGKDLSDFRDRAGHLIFLEFAALVRDHDEGYISYVWQWKDDPSRLAPKESYVKGFAPWGWIIGTGVYTEDVARETRAAMLGVVRVSLAVTLLVGLLLLLVVRQAMRMARAGAEFEHALSTSERRYRSFIEHFHGAAYQTDARLRPIFFHGAVQSITGYTEDDLLQGRPRWAEVVHPDDLAALGGTDPLAPGSDGGEREYRIVTKAGETRWVRQHTGQVLDETGALSLVQGVIYDITLHKQADAALQESEQIGWTLLNATHDAALLMDGSLVILAANAQASSLLGAPWERLVGSALSDVCSPGLSRVMGALARKAVECGEPAGSAHETGGRSLWASVIAVRTTEGAVTRLAAFIEDRTELRRAQETQRLAAVGQLAGGVAHEFNNLLAGMLLRAERAQACKTGDQYERLCELVLRSAPKGAELCQKLAAFAHPGKPAPVPVRLQEVIEAAVASAGAHIEAANIAVQRHYDAAGRAVLGDPRQLEQVFLDLVTNACDAMPQGGTLTVSTRLAQRHGHSTQVVARVTDTGTGIRAEDLPRVFEPFFTTKGVLGEGDSDSSGLGLAVAHGIIRSHGGMITVRSELGVGTTFEVSLEACTTCP